MPDSNTTKAILSAAFTEWDRRYREEPARFQSEADKAADTSESYGEACAEYFSQIISEQAAARSY